MMNQVTPTVDVMIPTCKPDEKFRYLMEHLQKQSYPIQKIILINTGAVLENEMYYMRRTQKHRLKLEIHHIEPREFDHGGTRNLAAHYSKSDILIFLTQDAVPKDAYLVERLVKALCEEGVALAYGRQLPYRDCPLIERYTRYFNYPDKSMVKGLKDLNRLGIKTYFASNVCAAYNRDIFDQIGGFEDKTIFNEDMLFAAKAIQAGYKVAYVSDAAVYHSHRYTNFQQVKRNFDLAVSQAQHMEVFGSIPSEGEGVRLVKQTALFLLRKKKAHLLPSLFLTSACKYAGYQLGKNYKKMPLCLVKALSLNKKYWSNQ